MSTDQDQEETYVEQVVYIDEPPDKMATVATYLSYAIALVIVTALSAFLYFYLTGVIDPPAPRTALESRLAAVEASLQENSDSGRLWRDYISVHSSMSRYADAQKAWEEATVILADAPEELMYADLAWAQSLVFQGRPEDAIAQAEKVIENDPLALEALARANPSAVAMGIITTRMLGPAWVVKANSYVALGQWQDAVDAYTVALELEPQAADLLGLRAAAYLQLGEEDKARADAEEALRFIPNDERARYILDELGESR